MKEDFDITKYLSVAAMLEQTAEEAAELAQACSKLARLYRGENPVRKTETECLTDLNEEIADIMLCMNHLVEDYKLICHEDIDSVYIIKQNRLENTLKEKGE